ncbi:MAG: DUF488 domain-containing protein [Sphingobacteriales bacterium]|jgi:uncharacterized protein (DUF488 family)|nr:MAG: DUF488 domain-containing protein [Sphingobacteriales bacterium]
MQEKQKTIYTIGHSIHSIEQFLAMLKSFGIMMLVDIRSLPGSRKFPQFDKENLQIILPENDIQYLHLLSLGGRQKVKKDSKNTRWRNDSFRGYADYMETDNFKNAIIELEQIAQQQATAYMCAEVLWWRCHRSMVSDYLKTKGWTVLHIMSVAKSEEHRYTAPARIVDSDVVYYDENLFDSKNIK